MSPEVADDVNLFHIKNACIAVEGFIHCTDPQGKESFHPCNTRVDSILNISLLSTYLMSASTQPPCWIWHVCTIQYVHTPSLTIVCVSGNIQVAAEPHS